MQTCSPLLFSSSDSSPQRRVLIVSPHFPPTNAPDHQRTRVALPYFAEFGWEPHILTVDPQQVTLPQDPRLNQVLPPELSILRTRALPIQATGKLGFGDLGWRCLPFFMQAGERLLSRHPFDLIFFSTTIFPVMTLGPRWLQKFGIPYVLDFQDPWRNEYYKTAKGAQRPGGRLKYAVAQGLARVCEPHAMRHVSQVISVSPQYPETLQHRYSWLRPDQFTVLPFGAPDVDFEQLPQMQIRHSIFDPQDGKRHWVYVGVVCAGMALALRTLFLSIQADRAQNPRNWDSIQLHFVGTSYAPADQAVKTVEPIAQACGVGDLVQEQTRRVPYFEAQQLLVDSDAILMIGSDDPGYTASKLYPCVLARKPILALFHQQSSVVNILRDCAVGQVFTFMPEDHPNTLSRQFIPHLQALLQLPKGYAPATNWAAFQPYTAREMTSQLCQVFDRSLNCSFKTGNPNG